MKGSGLISQYKLILITFMVYLLFIGKAFGFPCSKEPAIGEPKSGVAAMCGEAMLKEDRTIKVEETDEQGNVTRISKKITEWTYYSASDGLVQLFRFENGRLVRIMNVGYGKVNDFTNDNCRNGEGLKMGDSLAEAFLKCGEPISKEGREAKIVETEIPGKMRRTFVPVVEWTYRYGQDAPGYTVTFEDGVAVDIRTREFGK